MKFYRTLQKGTSPWHEEAFFEAWSRVSDLLLKERSSLKARLRLGIDGIWYSCANGHRQKLLNKHSRKLLSIPKREDV